MKFSDPYTNIKQMHINKGMHVADFGAGVGFYSLALAQEVGPTGMVYAIDVQADHLTKLKKEAMHRGWSNIDIVHGDLEAPGGSGLMGASIDRIVISNVLFQVEDPFILVREAKRILRPSGMIAVIDWSESYNRVGPDEEMVVDADRIIKMFATEGFEVATALDAGSHHYGYLFKRKSNEHHLDQ